jgi:hypothetical protein
MQQRLCERLIVATPAQPVFELLCAEAVIKLVITERLVMQIFRDAVLRQQHFQLVVAEPLETDIILMHGLLAMVRPPAAFLAEQRQQAADQITAHAEVPDVIVAECLLASKDDELVV